MGNQVAFEPFKPNIPIQISQIAAGADFLLCLDINGGIFASGCGQQGQLGRKMLERRRENGLIPSKLGFRTKAVYVAASEFNGFAVMKNGSVHAWGLQGFKQTGCSRFRRWLLGYNSLCSFLLQNIRLMRISGHADRSQSFTSKQAQRS